MAVPVNAVRAALHHLTEASGLETESHVHSLVARFRLWFDRHHPVARAFVVLRTQEQRRADGIDGENTAPLPNGITISAATRPLDPMEVYVVYRTADAWYAPPAMMREIYLQPRSDGAVHGGNDTVAEVAAIVNHDDRVNLPNVAAPSGDSDAQGRRFVSQYSTLYDTLRYVLFFPTGVGGWGQRGLGRSAQRPLSTAGHPFTCGGYARAAIYQKEVLSLLPRLTQEYTLDEFSRRESIGVVSYSMPVVTLGEPSHGRATVPPRGVWRDVMLQSRQASLALQIVRLGGREYTCLRRCLAVQSISKCSWTMAWL